MSGTVAGESALSTPYSATTASRAPARQRLLALDVFRGLTIAGMLLVNDPGTWSAIYPPLGHAAWHGWTPTDLIFPFFLFIVGITTHLSTEARRARGDDDRAIVRQILKRGAIIFGLGLFLSGFPFIPKYGFDIQTMRIPGVLQRIAVCYVAAGLLARRTSVKTQVLIVVGLLFGYWFAMTLIPVPGRGLGALWLSRPDATLAAYIDRLLLDGHLWQQSKTWDPEGPLSTIPAIGTAVLGLLAGRWIASPRPLLERIAALFAIGAIGMMVGLMWDWSFPINKGLWTSSYVVFTAGMACVVLATCLWLIDVQRVTWWTKPFVIFGVNPIIAFVGSGLMARLIYTTIKVNYDGRRVSLQSAIYQSIFAPIPGLDPRTASLLFALAFVGFWFVVLWALWRKGIILKV